MTALLSSLVAALFTAVGGMFAMKHTDRLHLILSFSAGAVIGVAFFDLMPEAFEQAASYHSIPGIAAFIALGFTSYMVLNRWLLLSPAHDEGCENPWHRGQIGAGTLSIHSFMDGAAIGIGFQSSSGLGIAIALAVLIHDFSDGINTVGMILKGNGSRRLAWRWLAVDAISPVIGVLSTFLFVLPPNYLAPALAVFCGFFLYIGASDMLPETHHAHPKLLSVLATLAGLFALYLAGQLTRG
jgi:zinc transporter ZupT